MNLDRDAYELIKTVGTWILLAPPTGIDNRGNRTYAADGDVKYRAFLQYAEREFRTGTTESRVARAIITMINIVIDPEVGDVVLLDLPNITPEYRLTLMDGSKPPITNVDNAVGDGTLDHLTLFT